MKATIELIKSGGYAHASLDRSDLAFGWACFYLHKIFHLIMWPLRATCEWLEIFGSMREDRDSPHW